MMKRTQVYYESEVLEDLRLYAQDQGLPLAEVLRWGAYEIWKKPKVKKAIEKAKMKPKNPVLALIGCLGKIGRETQNFSETVDEIYDKD